MCVCAALVPHCLQLSWRQTRGMAANESVDRPRLVNKADSQKGKHTADSQGKAHRHQQSTSGKDVLHLRGSRERNNTMLAEHLAGRRANWAPRDLKERQNSSFER